MLLCYIILQKSFFYDLNVFFAPKNLGIDNKIIKFELIVTELWSLRGFAAILDAILKKHFSGGPTLVNF